ncbi:vWA domain-containing protein [Gilvimarinus sp. DA14]|uniref:VWA domain-containing protein n=1 Tax=Gilvimarinus sp. DA14 TaxID=2956798 RepID=UPI0020B6ABEF|nr:vWA domain-containing protein [Gilvimarinus sp. DA14]UTF61177.1 VWA domain-containing protein [Gilvimarinus sp. DA14]
MAIHTSRISILLLLAVLLCSPAYAQTETEADVRLLVDISGSMKNTDPENLRQPALELMVKLLSDSTHAGVWTFGEQVNMLVPFARSDATWQRDALEKTARVNSVGLYTNMGEALERATEVGAKAPKADVILLTDGKIDIDKNASVNARERERVLTELLPQLAAKNFRLHTIALSDDADSELLQQLSRDSDGHHLVAKNADDLMQAYLQIFDQAVPAKRLPLENNTFLVDEQVNEFTALVFRAPSAKPNRLIPPEGEALSAASHPDNVRWYSADSYDLITIGKPKAGRWQLEAEQSPQNRVTVVSDLQLHVEPLPNNLVAGASLTLNYALQEKGQNITDADFLNLITGEAVITNLASEASWKVSLNEQPNFTSGQFQQVLPQFSERGRYRLRLTIDGKTFAREFQHQLQVGSLFAVNMAKAVDDLQVTYTVSVTAAGDLINADKTSVVAHVRHSSGQSELRALQRAGAAHWQLVMNPTEAARTVIELNASGELADGSSFDETLPTQYYQYPDEGDPLASAEDSQLATLKQQLEQERAALEDAKSPPPSDSAAAVDASHSSASSLSVSAPAQTPPDDQAKENDAERDEAESGGLNWPMIAAITLGNLVLMAGLYWGYRRFNTKDVQSELDEIEQQLRSGDGEAKESASEPQAAREKSNTVAVDDDDPMAALDSLESGADDPLPMDDFSPDSEDKKD